MQELAYYAQSGTYGRRTASKNNKEYIALQVEYCPQKNSNEKESSPIFLFSNKTARKIGWYFLKQSFINPICNMLKMRGD